jgi:hypothetical protein
VDGGVLIWRFIGQSSGRRAGVTVLDFTLGFGCDYEGPRPPRGGGVLTCSLVDLRAVADADPGFFFPDAAGRVNLLIGLPSGYE